MAERMRFGATRFFDEAADLGFEEAVLLIFAVGAVVALLRSRSASRRKCRFRDRIGVVDSPKITIAASGRVPSSAVCFFSLIPFNRVTPLSSAVRIKLDSRY